MGVARQAYLNQASAPADFLLYTHFQYIVKKKTRLSWDVPVVTLRRHGNSSHPDCIILTHEHHVCSVIHWRTIFDTRDGFKFRSGDAINS
jgi:hypothetical protein